jgi:hypothetical protein
MRNNLSNVLLGMTEKLSQLNSDYTVCEKCHKKKSKLQCDASSKKYDDSDSDCKKTEHFAKVTANNSVNKSPHSNRKNCYSAT